MNKQYRNWMNGWSRSSWMHKYHAVYQSAQRHWASHTYYMKKRISLCCDLCVWLCHPPQGRHHAAMQLHLPPFSHRNSSYGWVHRWNPESIVHFPASANFFLVEKKVVVFGPTLINVDLTKSRSNVAACSHLFHWYWNSFIMQRFSQSWTDAVHITFICIQEGAEC